MTKQGYQHMDFYSGTYDKWHNIVVTPLMWHMTYIGLYNSPDTTMYAVQKSPYARFADCR